MISRKVQYAFSLNYHISKTTVDYTRKKDLELVRPIYICIESVVALKVLPDMIIKGVCFQEIKGIIKT